MRLLNTSSLQLEEFSDELNVKYVILSHRWEDEEVLFQDISNLDTAKQLKGFNKVENLCITAKENNYSYAWIDTCCIDKNSSAELAEAINSMFRWYKNATECYVYLSDVNTGATETGFETQFTSSKWFTRGWTLQELLAPQSLQFFNLAWQPLGTKEDLIDEIYATTGIVQDALQGQNVLQFPIAERMSWAAGRKTKRIEDRAYSLMGIFNVNMPMIYGEGKKAFYRLQEEILKRSGEDYSIFAWTGVQKEDSGLLAYDPECFIKSRGLINLWENPLLSDISISSRGVNISINLTPWNSSIFVALLPCKLPGKALTGIYLRKISGQHYRRIRIPDGSDFLLDTSFLFHGSYNDRPTPLEKISVFQDGLASSVPTFSPTSTTSHCAIQVSLTSRGDPVDVLPHVLSQGEWDDKNGIARMRPGLPGELVHIKLSEADPELRVAKLGLDWSFRPRCVIVSSMCRPSAEEPVSFLLPRGDIFANHTQKGRKIVQSIQYNTQPTKTMENIWAVELPETSDETFLVLCRSNGDFLGEVVIASGVKDSTLIWDVRINLRRVMKAEQLKKIDQVKRPGEGKQNEEDKKAGGMRLLRGLRGGSK